ncbi:MAG TPA: hypothetical protein ENK91_16005, partial [Bacteroidetes bacterium]|nr:hypothetical protein [Bacteroidota bacterium]
MKEQRLELSYLKHSIIVMLLFFSINIQAQKIQVFDEERNPLTGVLVYSDDKKISDYTDNNGIVSFENIDENTFLNFYYLGYKQLRIGYSDILKNDNTVLLVPVNNALEEVIIIGRNNQFLEDIIPETKVISTKDIQVTESKSTADALMMSGSVFVQKTQFGGGSPVLRGFEANRVLLVLDGIRMNNAIYRNGHLQNSITVDNFSLKRIEVIFGAGSLNYGSDAIGGVIHFKTKDPVFNIINGKYKLRYSSAANEKTGYMAFNYGADKVSNLFIFSASSFGDLRAGNRRPKDYPDFGKRKEYVEIIDGIDSIVTNKDFNIQIGTGYYQYNLLNKTAVKLKKNTLLTLNFQYSNTGDIPRYDFLTEKNDGKFKYAEWYYGPQKRFLGSIRFDFENSNTFYDNATIIAATQKINEDRIYRKYRNEWKNFNLERLIVSSISADFKKYIRSNHNHELVYGMDLQHNDLGSSANRMNVKTGEEDFNILTRYPSGLVYNFRYGAYLQYVFGEKDYPVQVNLGSRIEHNNIKVKYQQSNLIDWPEEYTTGVQNKNTSYA